MSGPSSVTVIGLGRMGSALARALLARGHRVVVWNRTPERSAPLVAAGAIPAASVADAVAASPLCLMCVLDYAAADALLGSPGVAAALAGRTLVQLTSATPETVPAQQAWVQDRGARFLAGGIFVFPDAIGRDDALIYYGGSDTAFDEHRATLMGLAGASRYLGPDPRTAVAAYCTAGIFALGALGLFLETAALARHYDIPIDTYHGLARDGTALLVERMRDSVRRLTSGDFDGDDATNDMILAAMLEYCATFERTGIPTRMIAAYTAQLQLASECGAGSQDVARLAELLWSMRAAERPSPDPPSR